MNSLIKSISKKVGVVACTLAVTLLASVSQAGVTDVVLTDRNSVATVDVNSSAGMYQWSVGGINQLAQQWFWYRVDNNPYVQPINSISTASWYRPTGPNSLFTSYANAQLSVNITYKLTGGTGYDSDILESISVKNNSASPFNLHFFQYSDFDLDGNPLGDTVVIDPDLDFGGYWRATQTKLLNQLSETITAPNATRAEAAVQGVILNEFLLPGYNLNNTLGPVGPADVTWGLQWDFTVAAGATVDIFKDKRLDVSPIPEPAVFGVIGLGLALLVVRRRVRV